MQRVSVDSALAEARALLEAELSHNEISRQLSAAVKAGKPSGNGYYCWVREVFDDRLVYEEETPTGASLWSQPYTIAEDGTVTLGQAVKVKASTVYVPVKEAALDNLETGDLDEADAEFAGDVVPLVEKGVRKDGSLAVKLIAPGWGSSGYYSEAVLKRDGPKAFPKGTKMYWDHPTATEAKERPERSLKDLAAELTSAARYDAKGPAGAGLYAEAKAFGSFKGPIDELAPHIGTSIRAEGHVKKGEAEGRKGPVIEAITAGHSVDFVTQAGAGGQVVALFEAARGRAGTPAPEVDSVSDQELTEARTALEAAQRELEEGRGKIARLSEAALLREARDVVTATLGKVDNLPDITRARLIETIAKNPPVKDGALDATALTEAITRTVAAEVKYLAEVTRSGAITGMGGAGGDADAAIKESEARLESALGRSFGLSEAEAKIAAGGRVN